jgi:hypothetical protein
MMAAVMLEDIRRFILGLLFVVAFGWMAALVFPGGGEAKQAAWSQVALADNVVPPHP